MSHGVSHAADLEPLLHKADVVIVGPGLGQTAWSIDLLTAVLDCNKSLVVDADALNLLTKRPVKKTHWILTPHPGEAARLLNVTIADIQQDRVASIQKLQNKFDGVCVLKGSHTLTIGKESALSICEAGNPGMATAGMGDVLSGVVGGLLGQGIPLDVAAQLGVLVHALAGDQAAKLGERGMIASDLFLYLREVLKEGQRLNDFLE